MKQFYIFILLFITTLFFSIENKWDFAFKKNEITVYTRDIIGSNFKEYKGVGIINTTVGTLGALMEDLKSYPLWNGNCIHAEILIPINNGVMYQYFVNSAPWPIKGRDIILKTTQNFTIPKKQSDKNKGMKVVINIEGIKEELVPIKNEYVRMTNLTGKWIFEGLEQGKTKLTYIIKTDIGGMIPPALGNATSKKIPYKTIQSIKKMVRNQKYKTRGKLFLEEILKKNNFNN